jgi:hypothetical protein
MRAYKAPGKQGRDHGVTCNPGCCLFAQSAYTAPGKQCRENRWYPVAAWYVPRGSFPQDRDSHPATACLDDKLHDIGDVRNSRFERGN